MINKYTHRLGDLFLHVVAVSPLTGGFFRKVIFPWWYFPWRYFPGWFLPGKFFPKFFYGGISFKSGAKSFINGKYWCENSKYLVTFISVCRLTRHVFKTSALSKQACFELCIQRVNGSVDDAAFNAKRLGGANENKYGRYYGRWKDSGASMVAPSGE